jgi:hypothetical protein
MALRGVWSRWLGHVSIDHKHTKPDEESDAVHCTSVLVDLR